MPMYILLKAVYDIDFGAAWILQSLCITRQPQCGVGCNGCQEYSEKCGRQNG